MKYHKYMSDNCTRLNLFFYFFINYCMDIRATTIFVEIKPYNNNRKNKLTLFLQTSIYLEADKFYYCREIVGK